MFDKVYFDHRPFDWAVYLPPPPLITRILHVRHPALLTVIHRRGQRLIREYHDLSSLDDEYLTKQVGLDVLKGDTIEATTVAGISYRHQV